MEVFKKRVSAYQIAVHLIVVALAIEVILLAKQNRDLKLGLTDARVTVPQLKVGDRVPPIYLLNLDSRTEQINFEDSTKVYLLFVFNTTCPACKSNLPNWKEIGHKVDPSRCLLRGISLHDIERTKRYLTQSGIDFIVGVANDSVFIKSYKLYQIPQALLIEHGGMVKNVWMGQLNEAYKEEIGGYVFRPPD